MSYYLEDYLDRAESLPYELQQNVMQMRQKDERFEELREKISTGYHAYWKGTKKGPGIKSTNGEISELLMQQLKEDSRLANEIIEDKFTLANQTSEMLDQHIKRLDKDIKKFEKELEAQGVFPAMTAGTIQSSSENLDEEACFDLSFSGGSAMIKSPSLASIRKKGMIEGDSIDQLLSPRLLTMKRKRRPKSVADFSPADFDVASEGFSAEDERTETSDADYADADNYPITTPLRPATPRTTNENNEEPLYCLCRQVSYGDMIACDNPNCPYEWFHYGCVGLTAPPKGRWFCPTCTQKKRKLRARGD